MATTQNLHNGNGSSDTFEYTFPTLKDADVKAEVDNVITTAFTLLTSPTRVKFDSAPASGTNNVRLFRDTDVDTAKAVFAAGSSIRAQDLNNNMDQFLYASQEEQGATITTHRIADNAVTGAKIKADQIDSQHYVDGSIDTAHIGDSQVTTDKINNLAVTRDKIANSAVGNMQIGDDALDSRHYADLSIDTQHIGNLQITGAKIANDTIDSSKLTAGTVVTNSEQAAHTVNDTSFFTTQAAEARYFNASTSETIKDGQTFPDNDTTIATTAAINDRIIDLVEEVGGFVPIANETSFPNANPDINNGAGTLVSIKALSINLVSNGSGVATIADGTVGNSTVTITGLANNTTYDATFGMIVETTTTLNTYTFHRLTPKATEVTTVASNIANVNTVATNITNVNAVGNDIANVNTVAADAADIGAVAGKSTEIGRLGTAAAVEDMANLGTTACVADMAILGTAAVVEDLGILGTADVVADMNTLATTAVVSDMDTLADISANITAVGNVAANVTTVAGIASDVTAVAGDATDIGVVAGKATEIGRLGTADAVSDMNTLAVTDVVDDMALLGTSANVTAMSNVGTNIASVIGCNTNLTAIEHYGDTYQVGTGAPTQRADGSALVLGDLWFDSSSNKAMMVRDGSAGDGYSNFSPSQSTLTDIAIVSGNITHAEDLGSIGDALTTTSGNHVEVVADNIASVNRLGTADAVADMAILATTDIVADMNTLATADIVADMNTLATADIVSDMNTLAVSAVLDDMETCANNVSNINTVGGSIADVNRYANEYKIASSAPGSPSEGDLWYDDANNILKYRSNTAWESISSGGIQNTVEDTTPELGGHLDCNDKNLTEVATISGDNLQIDFGTL